MAPSYEYHQTLQERVAVLETKLEKLDKIEGKLDELLDLKSKGMGALSLVGLILGSGFLGVIALIMQHFRPHL